MSIGNITHLPFLSQPALKVIFSMIASIKKSAKRSESIVCLFYYFQQLINKHCFSDLSFIKWQFKQRLGRNVELANPVLFNDKMQWLKLNWTDPLAAKCSDKYAVREFVEETIGPEYLNDLYAVFESAGEINIENLPNAFVLKATHGSGYNVICKDKSKVNWRAECKKIKNWLRINFFWHTREWVYKNIKPRIICEKYLEDAESGQLYDIKIYCFNGNPKFIVVDFDRFVDHKTNLYDLDWNFLDVELNCKSDKKAEIKKPRQLDEVIELSRKLSESFPFVRADFYLPDNKIIFGEMTFFPSSGIFDFKPKEFEAELGNWLTLPI